MAQILSGPELARLIETLQVENMRLPLKWDWEVLGGCDRVCAGCWGPAHNVRRTVSIVSLLQFAWIGRELGMCDWVITGGEPLMDHHRLSLPSDRMTKPALELVEQVNAFNQMWVEITGNPPLIDPIGEGTTRELDLIIRALNRMGIQVTLSTSGVGLMPRVVSSGPVPDSGRPVILRNLSELGVPLAGDTPERNAIMRPPAGRVDPHSNFWSVVRILREVPRYYPKVLLTLRTEVTAVNADWVLGIPAALKREGVDLRLVRWKLYQFNTKVDTLLPPGEAGRFKISRWRFEEIVRLARERYATEFRDIVGQPAAQSGDRYGLINPAGTVRLLRQAWPQRVKTVVVGTILSPEPLIRCINRDHADFLLKQAAMRPTSGWRF
jgi:hypothetical protein